MCQANQLSDLGLDAQLRFLRNAHTSAATARC